MTDTNPSGPRARTQEAADSDSRPPPAPLAAALAPGRSPNERQRELVHASLITRWAPKQIPQRHLRQALENQSRSGAMRLDDLGVPPRLPVRSCLLEIASANGDPLHAPAWDEGQSY